MKLHPFNRQFPSNEPLETPKYPSAFGYTLVPTSILVADREKIERLEFDLENTREMVRQWESEQEFKPPFRWFQFWQKALLVAMILLALVLVVKYSKELL